MERVKIEGSMPNTVKEIKKAMPFYFSINDTIGTLSFLCITNEDEKFALHCNYKLEDFEVNYFYCCKICNKALTLAQNLVNIELIRNLPNYLSDLTIYAVKTNKIIGVKVDDEEKCTDDTEIFYINNDIVDLLGATDDFIRNYGTTNLDFSTNLNYLKNESKKIYILKSSDVSLYKMAPSDKGRKTKDVLVWLDIKQNDEEYSIICRFLLDNPLKKKKFKKITKESLEREYLLSLNPIYIVNFMYDMDLYDGESSFILRAKNNHNKEMVSFNLDSELKDMIINLIENY